MNISRGTLLAKLNEAAIGLSAKATIEQSDCFCFNGKTLTTFNDEIMVRTANPLAFDAVVNAQDLLTMLSKMPDEEIEASLNGNYTELKLVGKRRKAGLSCTVDVHLPVNAVPRPELWHKLAEGCLHAMQQAATACGDNDAQYLATCVHVTPQRVEGCDNFRLLRVGGGTGFPEEVLIPAKSVQAMEGLEVTHVSMGKGWVHFKTASGTEVSARCSHEAYHKQIDNLLELDKPEAITLPANLGEMVERAEVFSTGTYDFKIGVRIADGELVLTSRKEGGWYKERKKIKYEGRRLEFDISPKFLVEILSRTRDVTVDNRRMKLVSGAIQFVTCLYSKEEVAKNVAVDNEDQKFTEDDIPF